MQYRIVTRYGKYVVEGDCESVSDGQLIYVRELMCRDFSNRKISSRLNYYKLGVLDGDGAVFSDVTPSLRMVKYYLNV